MRRKTAFQKNEAERIQIREHRIAGKDEFAACKNSSSNLFLMCTVMDAHLCALIPTLAPL